MLEGEGLGWQRVGKHWGMVGGVRKGWLELKGPGGDDG